jgi:uncharacterized protein YdaU (DUF1376 family)
MKRPWIPFKPVDYLADTQHLATVQHGAYLLLILHYWTHEGLPDNERELARITKLPLHSWRAMQPTIQQFFHDGWQHKRIDEDLAKVGVVLAKRKRAGSIGGTKSAIARWNGKQMLGHNVSNRAAKHPANVKLREEDISNTVSGAARARAAPSQEKPTNSNNEANQGSESVPTKPPKTTLVHNENLSLPAPKILAVAQEIISQSEAPIGSNELRALVVSKGWGY